MTVVSGFLFILAGKTKGFVASAAKLAVCDKCRLQNGTPVSLNSALVSLNNVPVSLNSAPVGLNSVLVSLFTVSSQ